MKPLELELPSNKKFGYFFTLIFLIFGGYFYSYSFTVAAFILIVIATIFFLVTLIKADLLLALNKLWMRFGLLLGVIVGPIVLSLIYFGIFTPIALIMRLSGRDELRLKFKKKTSHWIMRKDPILADSFKNQF